MSPVAKKARAKRANTSNSTPVDLARKFVSLFARHPDGPTLRRWRGEWFRWTSERGSYAKVTDEMIAACLYRDLDLSEREEVTKTAHALISVDDVLIDSASLGSWLECNPEDEYEPLDVAVCTNGLLHLPTRRLFEPTPNYFSTTSLGAPYVPTASPPEKWLRFLGEVFPGDSESIETLQEWFGYQLTPDTRQQKIMGMIGARRSGKGTIGRVANALLGGQECVASPTLSQLGTNFGCACLIGKSAAIIGDARLGRGDDGPIIERLLSISGQDLQTIDRKYLAQWIGYLNVRFTIISNEVPRFTDASDALPGRMLLLDLKQTFFDREDTKLTEKLLAELPGILLWAIEGWKRLRERGRFLMPRASADLAERIARAGHPVRAWLADRCVRDADAFVLPDLAYQDFRAWWKERHEDEKPPTQTYFGENLETLVEKKRPRIPAGDGDRDHDKRPRAYVGIRLRP